MDERAQSSTIGGSETVDSSPPLSRQQPHKAALEAAEYLRSHNLTVPYENIFHHWMLNEPRKLVSPSHHSTGLTSWDGLAHCSIPSAVSAPEKWDVCDKSLCFLQDVCKRQSQAQVEGYIQQIRDQAEADRITRRNLDLPALRTDNDMDLRRHQRKVCAAREVHLSDHHLPLEPCDEAKDEGLEFPQEAYAAGRTIMQSVEDEKIEISKASFQTLMRYLKADWTGEDQDAMLMSRIQYKGLVQEQPVTPPLTPKLQNHGVFVPDEATCEVPQPSDPSSVMSDDLRNVEGRIFDDEDDSAMSKSDMEQCIDPHNGNVPELEILATPVRRQDDLKVDEPLFPAGVPDQEIISPDFQGIHDSIPQDTFAEDDAGDEETDTRLNESLKEASANLMLGIEQEKLEPLDATIRVHVPILDFSIPEPEWFKLPGDPESIFTSIPRQYDVLFTGLRWTSKLVEESRMVWQIWSSYDLKPAVEEPICETALLVRYLEPVGDAGVPTSSNYVRKRPGLSVLGDDGDDDEEELQPAVAPPPSLEGDWTTLIKKRKLRLDGDDARQKTGSNESSRDDKFPRSARSFGALGNILVHEKPGGAATLLDNYMELHPPKKVKLEQSPFFKKPQAPHAKESAPVEKTRKKTTTRQSDLPTIQPSRIMPCPNIPRTDKPLRLIVAVNLPRGVLQHLERLLPGLQLIDRDYSAHNSSAWIPNSVCRAEVHSAVSDEADIIASPSTGIILTTMIKVRQKPLPGGGVTARGSAMPLTARLEKVAAKYERLVVLVSEGNRLDEGAAAALSPADAAALAAFQAFAAALPAETAVLYVGGGAEALARWAAAAAARCAGAAHRECLVQRETPWELFLRRAGLNAYAAQVVLAALRAPEGEPVLDRERAYGLPAFVKMRQEDRVAMFEAVLGGRRVLAEVGRVLDASWGGVARRQA